MKAKMETSMFKQIIKWAGASTKTKSILDPIKMRFGSKGVIDVAVSDEAKTVASILRAVGVAEVDEDFEVILSPKVILRVLDDYLKFSESLTLSVENDKLILETSSAKYSEPLLAADVVDVSDVVDYDNYMTPKIEAEVAGVYAFDISELKNLGTEDYVDLILSDTIRLEIPVGSGVVSKSIPANVIRKYSGSEIKYRLSKQPLKLIVSALSGNVYVAFMHVKGSPAPLVIGCDRERIKVAYWLVPLEV